MATLAIASRTFTSGEAAAPDGAVLWLILGGLTLGILGIASLRKVAEYERVLVLRFGRVVRVRGPGLVPMIPGLESVMHVSLRARRLQPLFVRAATRDGVVVQVKATALCRVSEPVRSLTATADPLSRTAEVVETAIQGAVSETDLERLRATQQALGARCAGRANQLSREWGVEVLAVDITDVELTLTADLLRWAEGWAARRSATETREARVI